MELGISGTLKDTLLRKDSPHTPLSILIIEQAASPWKGTRYKWLPSTI